MTHNRIFPNVDQTPLTIAQGRRVAAMRRAIKRGVIDTPDNLDAAAERMLDLNDRTEDAMTDIPQATWKDLSIGVAKSEGVDVTPLVQRDQQGRTNVYPVMIRVSRRSDRICNIVFLVMAACTAGAIVWQWMKGPVTP